jgi:beta-glucosidase
MGANSDRFPGGFLWGASTSAYQVEGGNTYCDWYEWEAAGNSQMCGEACGHYRLYPEDFAMAKELGHNAHRLGLEWSRLEKTEGVWDSAEWDHYKKALDKLLEFGIEPFLTLNHFTMPLWLSKKGSWLSDESPFFFARFAEKASRELGSRVKYWITINEPNILATLAYFWGQWPPCHKDFSETQTVLINMLKGHALSYAAIKGSSSEGVKPLVGVAKAVTAFHPCRRSSLQDRLAAHRRDRFHNHSFISSLLSGRVELAGRKEKLPGAGTLDFIGLNYYFRQFIRNDRPFSKDPFGEVCSTSHHPGSGAITDMGWEIYPRGLYEVVKSFSRYRLPLFVTENGIATRDDDTRKDYIKNHLLALLKAISEGSPVKGYLHWSLLDNFEWDSGYSKKFGLVEVDFDTQKRTIRDSARYYSQVIRSGEVL